MSSDSFQPVQPVQPEPSGRPVAPAGSPFAQPAVPTPGSFAPPVPELEPVRTAAPRSRRGGGGMLLNALLGLALVVAVGGVAFAAGRATAPVAAAATGRTGFGGNGGGFAGGPTASGAPGAGFGGAAGGVSVQGTVTAVSADSITIQTAGGQSVTIPIDAQTTYAQRTPSTASAVTSGSTVVVQLQGGRGAFGNGNGNGNGGQGTGPNASGAPGRTLGPASTITVVPPAS